MRKIENTVGSTNIAILIFFIAHLFYFIFFNRYYFLYQEQVHLFRFDTSYLSDFLARPGGFTDYLSSFLIQFYYIPVLGAVIVTLAGFSVFKLSSLIFSRFNLISIIPCLLPVIAILLLQIDPYFTVSFTIGMIASLGAAAFYTGIQNRAERLIWGIILWILLYVITGSFSFLALTLFIIKELFSAIDKYSILFSALMTVAAVILPYFSWIRIYQIPFSEIWLSRNITPVNMHTRYGGFGLLIYYPLILTGWLVLRHFIKLSTGKTGVKKYYIIASVIASLLVFLSVPGMKKLVDNHHRISTAMKLDYCIQTRQWEKGLSVSSKYTKPDPLITFFTNICLLKTGQLSERMFNYHQVGRDGLFLNWVEDDVTPFFGEEIFYQLGYNSESYRWAYEAYIATGQGPRLMKRLVLTSILHGDDNSACKYLKLLDRTLFYHNWANHYTHFLESKETNPIPSELSQASEIKISNDFFYDLDDYRGNMKNLLDNNPDDRNLYEYTMALHLLEKDLPSFVADIRLLKHFGYKEIPVHFEEALLVYIVNTNQDVVPEGYKIRESTLNRFRYYLNTFSAYVARPKAEAANALSKEYSNTYWYYSQFN